MRARIRRDWPRTGHYRTILADPPWPEYGGGRITRGAQRHYPLLSVAEIGELPVGDWAEPSAHLYLWTTNNYLPAALAILTVWGFRYVTLITWNKDRIGLGQYYRGMTEHCIFAVRGRLPYRTLPDGKRAQGRTAFFSPKSVHSAKPEQVALWAEQVSHGPRLEVFARRRRPGWDAWGRAASADTARML